MKTTWKKWKAGLMISIALGFLSGGAGLTAGMGWRPFIAVTCTAIASHICTYLMKSPLEDVDDGTSGPPPAK